MLNIKNDQSNKMKAVTIERPINTNVDHGCTEKFPLSKNLYQQYILKTTLLNFSIDIFYDFNTFYQTLQSYLLQDPKQSMLTRLPSRQDHKNSQLS